MVHSRNEESEMRRILLSGVVVFGLLAPALPADAQSQSYASPTGGNVTIRSTRAVANNALGLLVAGTSVPSDPGSVQGGSYLSCGGGNRWTTVYRPTYIGYVARNCVSITTR
jgi:hypothetical protein